MPLIPLDINSTNPKARPTCVLYPQGLGQLWHHKIDIKYWKKGKEGGREGQEKIEGEYLSGLSQEQSPCQTQW